MKITGVEIAWVEEKPNEYLSFYIKYIYKNDQVNKINTQGDFENETPTHMSATHAISKIEQKSQNRIPRELDQKFGIPRIVTIY